MGQVALKNADFSVITSDNPRTEDPERIIDDICKDITTDTGSYKTITNRREAIGYAIGRAEKNDLVLIAGKGHEKTQLINGLKLKFCDKKVVTEFIRRSGE